MTGPILANASCVAIQGRGILIEGAPGSGKSSLAFGLIDRGAMLVGDDGVTLQRRGDYVWALPPPNIAGNLEIRGVGIVDLPTQSVALTLAIALGHRGERLPSPAERDLGGVLLPQLAFDIADFGVALRVEWALRLHGLPLPAEWT